MTCSPWDAYLIEVPAELLRVNVKTGPTSFDVVGVWHPVGEALRHYIVFSRDSHTMITGELAFPLPARRRVARDLHGRRPTRAEPGAGLHGAAHHLYRARNERPHEGEAPACLEAAEGRQYGAERHPPSAPRGEGRLPAGHLGIHVDRQVAFGTDARTRALPTRRGWSRSCRTKVGAEGAVLARARGRSRGRAPTSVGARPVSVGGKCGAASSWNSKVRSTWG
jgi:hypothetical protein